MLLLLAFVETRRFYVLFFKKRGGLGSSEKRCRMLDFDEKASSGNVGSETPPSPPFQTLLESTSGTNVQLYCWPARNNSAVSYSFTILSRVD